MRNPRAFYTPLAVGAPNPLTEVPARPYRMIHFFPPQLEKVRAKNRGGDVHLVGGVRTIETFRAMGALDKLGLLVLPFFLGGGMRLTPAISTDTKLVLEQTHALAEGAVEIIYACS